MIEELWTWNHKDGAGLHELFGQWLSQQARERTRGLHRCYHKSLNTETTIKKHETVKPQKKKIPGT